MELVGIGVMLMLATAAVCWGFYVTVLAGPTVELASPEELETAAVDILKANALNRREWASAFENWFMNLKMKDHIVFSTKFMHEGEVKLTKEFDEESRKLTDREGGHFEIDFACENRINLKHGSLKYDIGTSHFQVRWGGKHYIDFNDAFDDITDDSANDDDTNSWCTYSHTKPDTALLKNRARFTIRCKTVAHAETDIGKEYTDGFVFEWKAQKSRVNEYKTEV